MPKLIALSTKAVPAQQFTVDGEPYELYGLAHLNPTEEAVVMAAIAQYQRLNTRLAVVASRVKGEQYARKMAELRVELLTKMTNLPADVAGALPPPQQLALFSAVVDQLGEDIDSDDDDDDDLTAGGVRDTGEDDDLE